MSIEVFLGGSMVVILGMVLGFVIGAVAILAVLRASTRGDSDE